MRGLVISAAIFLTAFAASVPVALFLQRPTENPPPVPPPRAPALAASEPLTLLFVGDVMLDRAVASHAKAKGDHALFAGVADLFSGVDHVVANLEGTITTYPSVAVPNSEDLRFTFDPHFATLLKTLGITIVSLSNNHTDDFGKEGYAQTKRYLSEVGVSFFGSSDNTELSRQIQVRGRNTCFVGYEGFINASTTPVVREIQRLRPLCAFVITTMHDGAEYQATSTAHQQNAAHAFVDAGADVVIGTHPHVVQPIEIYKGKAIFYSLGNFMFDQDFSFATTHGIAVRAEFDTDTTHFSLIPTTIKGQEVSRTEGDDALKTLSRLIDRALPFQIASDILNARAFTLP